MNLPTGETTVTRSVTKTPRDKAARVGWMRRRRRVERDEWCQGRRIGRDETGFALLITRRLQVCSSLRRCYGRHFTREAAA